MKKLYGLMLAIMILLLTGCTGIEPERRSFPLAVSIDYVDDELQVIYAMANLHDLTGQYKSTGEAGLVQGFTGQSMDEVLKNYNSSREYYLDLGHVQVIVLGTGLIEKEQKLQEILTYLEQEPDFADSIYVFTCEDPQSLMAVNGTTVEALSEYLIGIYQNKVISRADQAVTLQEILYAWHNDNEMIQLPEVLLKDGRPQIPSLAD